MNCEKANELAIADAAWAPEKEFYLEEFRRRTLVLALPSEELPNEAEALQSLVSLVDDLVRNETRLVLVLGSAVPRRTQALLQEIATRHPTAGALFDANGRVGTRVSRVDLRGGEQEVDADFLARAWLRLREHGWFVVVTGEEDRARVHDFATAIAAKLQVHKLVLVEPEGGIADGKGTILPFMDASMLDAVLAVGQAEWAGLGHRRALFAAVRRALAAGVGSVNVCCLRGLAEELFTYTGSGTLFTSSDYCTVERLRVDDFPEVERLLARGVREGVLKPRSPEEIARLLVQAYGAVVGAHHLAGVCALESERYRAEGAGEIIGLYTITRFKGEGIGRKLLARVLADARALGLRYVFACTSVPTAQAFFSREGFRVVPHSAVPAAKWSGYPVERKRAVVALRLDLETSA
ncbi:MAG: GNAT family N-acetyltransferase [Candidatus Binatia bacterium]|nr:GNAT family N-acetyltransferase [Candidatus Binatia bacterium]